MKQGAKYSIEELSLDALYDGRIVLYQPKKGYRFSVDSPLLSWFSRGERIAENCADLGCGCGVIGISLVAAQKVKRVVGVEIQPRLAALSLKNVAANAMTDRIDIVTGDILEKHSSLPSKQFDLVVSNPPFWPLDKGRLPPDRERQIARHEMSITLSQLVKRAKQLLHTKKGRFCIAFPARRVEILFESLASAGLNVSRLTFVHPNPETAAELVLLEARIGRAGQLTITPPLCLKNLDNNDSPLVSDILSGTFCPNLREMTDLRPQLSRAN